MLGYLFLLIIIFITYSYNVMRYIMNKIKLIIYNNTRVVITNYLRLKEIKEEVIQIDNVIINGINLKLKSMDEYMIEVVGKIKGIKYEDL